MFTFFTAYQIYLLIQIDTQRNGRLIGIIFYLFITAASFFALVHKTGLRIARSVLLIAGLLLLFGIKLFNASAIFGSLDFANAPSVLRCAVYVVSQLGTIMLAVYYLFFRHNKKINSKRKLIVALMAFVIVLYVSVLIMECVLIMNYRVNIEAGCCIVLALSVWRQDLCCLFGGLLTRKICKNRLRMKMIWCFQTRERLNQVQRKSRCRQSLIRILLYKKF